eukprot:357759-Chlamydomonas_euryale.AAC.1
MCEKRAVAATEAPSPPGQHHAAGQLWKQRCQPNCAHDHLVGINIFMVQDFTEPGAPYPFMLDAWHLDPWPLAPCVFIAPRHFSFVPPAPPPP